MRLTSPAFDNDASIPVEYTADGTGASVPLKWSDLPEDVEELALIAEDPDAPNGTFVHWVAWGIPPDAPGLGSGQHPPGMHEGRNGWDQLGYGPPSPPPGHGTHRYIFTLLALDEPPDLADGAGAEQLRRATAHNVVASAHLTGTYSR
jgi:Raf kinase inhibitor-like YbhB/YbcL family protein